MIAGSWLEVLLWLSILKDYIKMSTQARDIPLLFKESTGITSDQSTSGSPSISMTDFQSGTSIQIPETTLKLSQLVDLTMSLIQATTLSQSTTSPLEEDHALKIQVFTKGLPRGYQNS